MRPGVSSWMGSFIATETLTLHVNAHWLKTTSWVNHSAQGKSASLQGVNNLVMTGVTRLEESRTSLHVDPTKRGSFSTVKWLNCSKQVVALVTSFWSQVDSKLTHSQVITNSIEKIRQWPDLFRLEKLPISTDSQFVSDTSATAQPNLWKVICVGYPSPASSSYRITWMTVATKIQPSDDWTYFDTDKQVDQSWPQQWESSAVHQTGKRSQLHPPDGCYKLDALHADMHHRCALTKRWWSPSLPPNFRCNFASETAARGCCQRQWH